MNVRRLLTYSVIAAILILGLAACVRSKAPATGGTSTQLAPGTTAIVGTGDVMGQLELFVTQTAMAAQGGGAAQTQAPGAGQTPAAPSAQPQTTAVAPGSTPEPGASTQPAEATPLTQPAQPAATTAPAGPAPTFVPVPTSTPGLPSTYVLQAGEFPFCIARRFNVNPSELLSSSGLNTNSTFYAGMTLNIPQTGNPFNGERALKAHPTTYTVSARDTIFSIACQFGDADPNAIAFANSLSAPYTLTPGKTLQIP